QFGASATWELFRPLAGNSLNTLPDPMNIVGAFLPIDIYLGLVRTLFTALSLWMAFVILRQSRPLFAKSTPEAAVDERE
ncbi:MAG TPA: hypothetical protein VF201_07990, partial [Nitrolancea sp.]